VLTVKFPQNYYLSRFCRVKTDFSGLYPRRLSRPIFCDNGKPAGPPGLLFRMPAVPFTFCLDAACFAISRPGRG